MSPELPPTLPPTSPPPLPLGFVNEIPQKRAEILGIDMEPLGHHEIDYQMVRRYPIRRRKSYKCSATAPLCLLVLGLFLFLIGYIAYSIILGTEEYELQASDNVLLLKTGFNKFLIVGEDTVTITPDSIGYTDEEYVEYNFTLISQEILPLYNRKLNITMENYKIVFDGEIQEKTSHNDCNQLADQLCTKVTKYIPFGGYEMNKIVVFYSLTANGHPIRFKRTFNVEIDEDKRTAIILEHVLRKVFNEKKN